MDIQSLPDSILSDIVDLLPFEEGARIGRVCKTFRRISQSIISKTKWFDLSDDRFKNLKPFQLATILDLCAPKLEFLRISKEKDQTSLLNVFVEYSCPRLEGIELGNYSIEKEVLEKILRQNPNLKGLSLRVGSRNDMKFIEYPDVVTNLKALVLYPCNNGTFQSLTNRCPNLNYLDIVIKDVTVDVLDQFFASVPNLELIDMLVMGSINLEKVAHFWSLDLISMEFMLNGREGANDVVLKKVASSFQRLQHLRIKISDNIDESSIKNAIESLAGLPNLESLALNLPWIMIFDGNMDNFQQLRKLRMPITCLRSPTFIRLVRKCPRLEYLEFRLLNDLNSPEHLAEILDGLSGIGKQKIKIGFSMMFENEEDHWKEFWESDVVKEKFKQLKEKDGFEVEMSWIKGELYIGAVRLNMDGSLNFEDGEEEDPGEGQEYVGIAAMLGEMNMGDGDGDGDQEQQ